MKDVSKNTAILNAVTAFTAAAVKDKSNYYVYHIDKTDNTNIIGININNVNDLINEDAINTQYYLETLDGTTTNNLLYLTNTNVLLPNTKDKNTIPSSYSDSNPYVRFDLNITNTNKKDKISNTNDYIPTGVTNSKSTKNVYKKYKNSKTENSSLYINVFGYLPNKTSAYAGVKLCALGGKKIYIFVSFS